MARKKVVKRAGSETVKQMILITAEQKAWLDAASKKADHSLSDFVRMLIEQTRTDPDFEFKLRRTTLETRLNTLAAETEALREKEELTKKELQSLTKQ